MNDDHDDRNPREFSCNSNSLQRCQMYDTQKLWSVPRAPKNDRLKRKDWCAKCKKWHALCSTRQTVSILPHIVYHYSNERDPLTFSYSLTDMMRYMQCSWLIPLLSMFMR